MSMRRQLNKSVFVFFYLMHVIHFALSTPLRFDQGIFIEVVSKYIYTGSLH